MSSKLTSTDNFNICGEFKVISFKLSPLIHCWFPLIYGMEEKASMTFRSTCFSIHLSQLRGV